jgi:hypothetical protein
MLTKLKNNKQKVEHLLSQYAETRDSDKKLFLMYLHEFTKINPQVLRDFAAIFKQDQVPCTETLRRIRQSFQSKGMYVGTKKVRQKREDNEIRVREGINDL